MNKVIRSIAVACCLALAACESSSYIVTKRSAIDAQIEAARQSVTLQMSELAARETQVLSTKVLVLEGQKQAAANYLFKGLAVGSALKTPTRPEMVMTQSIQQTATQLPPATAATQVEVLTQLQRELDEARVGTEELRKQYEQELGIARAEGAAKAAAVTELDTKLKQVDQDRLAALAAANAREIALQAEKDKVQDKELALQTKATDEAKRDAERAKSVQAIKVKMSAISGGLALLCLAGAIWSPVFKSKFGLGAAILGMVTAGIWFVQPWHLGLALGLSVLALVAWAAKNHYIESRAATNVYRAVQAVKEQSREEYDRVVKPALTTWNTVYNKKGEPVPDVAAIKHIDKVLRDAGDL